MKEIRLRWRLGLHHNAHGPSDGGGWCPDTSDNRRDLQILVEEGSRVAGPDSYWIETREASRPELVQSKPRQTLSTCPPLSLIQVAAAPIGPALSNFVRTASSGFSSNKLAGDEITRFAALVRAQAFEDAALIVEAAQDLLQDPTLTGAAAALRAAARAAAQQGR